jgi:hypothetical protein
MMLRSGRFKTAGRLAGPTSTGRGIMKMKKVPLAVQRAEMLKMIEHLQKAARGLEDVNAGVSSSFAEDLQRIREQVADAESPKQWDYLQNLAGEILVKIAVELLFKALM